MRKRLLKKVIMRDQLKGNIPIKWTVEFWLASGEDETSLVLSVIKAKYLMPAAIANKLKGGVPVRKFKDKILIEKELTVPEIILSTIGIQIPNQMEIQKILQAGGIQIVRQKKN